MVQLNGSQVMTDESGAGRSWQDGLATSSSLELPAEVRVSIVYDTDIVTVRSKAQELGLTLGFSNWKIIAVVAATVELARKIYQSRCPGEVALTTVHQAPNYGIMVSARGYGLGVPDNGPDLMRVIKLMDEFNVNYDEHRCMEVTATKWVSGRAHHSGHNGS